MSEAKTMYENQRSITTHKENHDNGKRKFGVLDLEAMEIAMQTLKPTTYKVWSYFDKNQSGYEFALSRVAVMRFCRVSNDTYHKAIRELIETGYLVETGANQFDFYEMPHEQDNNQEKALSAKYSKRDRRSRLLKSSIGCTKNQYRGVLKISIGCTEIQYRNNTR